MHGLAKQLLHLVSAGDSLAIAVQNRIEAIDCVHQRVAILPRDRLVHRGVAAGQAYHAAIPWPSECRIGVPLDRFGKGRADREGQMAEQRHLLVVGVGTHEARPGANRAHHLEPCVERPDILTLGWVEDPGLLIEDGGIALVQPALRLAGHRVAAKKTRGIRQTLRPPNDRPLDAGHIRNEGSGRDDGCEAFNHTGDLVDRRRDHHDVAVRNIAQIRRCLVDSTALHRRGRAFRPPRHARDVDRVAQAAQGQAERTPDETEPDDTNPHYATPTVRFSAAATASTRWTRWANACGVSDCAPSESATSGCACTSTIRPSAPAAIPASAIGVTRERRPVPWLGSTITGR